MLADVCVERLSEDSPEGPEPNVNLYSVGGAMLAALAQVGCRLEAPDEVPTPSEVDRETAALLIHRALGVEATVLRPKPRNTTQRHDQVLGRLISLIGVNFSIQAPFAVATARVQALVGSYEFGSLAAESDSDLQRAIEEHFGAPYGLVLGLLTSLSGHTLTDLRLHGPTYLKHVDHRGAFAALVRTVGCDSHDVKAIVNDDLASSEGLASGVTAFFLRNPIVHLGAQCYLLAPHILFKQALGLGMFFEVRRAVDGVHDATRRDALYKYLGHRFQGYVGELLKHRDNVIHVHDEYSYMRGKLSADHIVFDRGKDTRVLLVEDKSVRMARDVFLGADFSRFEQQVESSIARPVAQVIEFMRALELACSEGRLNAARRELSERILATREFLALVVLPFMPPVFSLPEVRRVVRAAALARLKPETQAWLRRTPRVFRWHVVGVEAIETYAAMNTRHGFETLVRQYVRSLRHNSRSVTAEGVVLPLKEWLKEKAGPHFDTRQGPTMSLVDAVFRDLETVFQ